MPAMLAIVALFNVHVILMGRSPLLTRQLVMTTSSELMGSLPKSKGKICGGTLFLVTWKEASKLSYLFVL